MLKTGLRSKIKILEVLLHFARTNPFLCGEMKNIEIYSRITFFIFIDLKNLLPLNFRNLP